MNVFCFIAGMLTTGIIQVVIGFITAISMGDEKKGDLD